MRSFSPIDLIRAHPWRSAFFTTYSLSLSYFEAVILDALIRQNVRQNLILADIVGIRAALSEHGARNAGRSYQIEPVAVEHGCFHAKMIALTAPDEAHLVIGSGNLTVGGWGANLECVEHLHPSFAADAFDDAADFLEALATTNNAKHSVTEECARLAGDFRRLSKGRPRSGNVRLVSNIEQSIFDQIVAFAHDMGGAEQLAIASPFFDDGTAIDRLCIGLGLDQVSVHAHSAGSVAGTAAVHWPERSATRVTAVTIEPLEGDTRHLHAKLFELSCRRGRLVMSGSANATVAALAQGRNIEMSVVRLQRDRTVGWRLSPATRPCADTSAVDETESQDECGILRAVLRGHELIGQILTRFPKGSVDVFQLAATGPRNLATATVSPAGDFTIITRSLELEAWTAQRFVLRVQSVDTGKIAEGFVFFPDIAEVTRRAGAIASRLLAILSGTETPIDVAAVMTWFFENPEHLRTRFGGGHANGSQEQPETYAIVANLLDPLPNRDASGEHGHPDVFLGWRRFMDQILSAFCSPRGRISVIGRGDDGVEGDEDLPQAEPNAQVDQALAAFDHLFALLIDPNNLRRDLGLALHISQYVCDRLEPPEAVVEGYLDRLLGANAFRPVSEPDRLAFAAAILVSAGRRQNRANRSSALRNARRHLLRLGVSIGDAMPDMVAAHGFARILTPDLNASELWTELQGVRTFQEEVKLYRLADAGPIPASEFPALATLPEWPLLATATTATRGKIVFQTRYSNVCPSHYMKLPAGEASRLKGCGVGRAANCCSAILMCEEL